MNDWLELTSSTDMDLSLSVILIRLVLAAAAGVVVAAISHMAHGHRKSDAPMLMTTLVLLTILICMVTLVIGNSVARAFGLVGALSIVRFRTVVDDTRDTAFVIFAVIAGMALGAGVWLVPAIGLPLVGIIAILLDRQTIVASSPLRTHTLTVRVGLTRDPSELFDQLFDRYLATHAIQSVGTAKQGAAIEITYAVSLREPRNDAEQTSFIVELNRIDGIQSVELSQL